MEDRCRRSEASAEPAYAEGFGVAGAHLSRRSESEGGTPNIQPASALDGLRRGVHPASNEVSKRRQLREMNGGKC